jgi:hypothetical protein
MTDVWQAFLTYLGTTSHWPRISLLMIGLGIILTGLGWWWQACASQPAVESMPARGYRRGHEVSLNELDELPLDVS